MLSVGVEGGGGGRKGDGLLCCIRIGCTKGLPTSDEGSKGATGSDIGQGKLEGIHDISRVAVLALVLVIILLGYVINCFIRDRKILR